MKIIKKCTTGWSVKVKEAGKGHTYGAPHVAAWEGFLEAFGEADVGAKSKGELEALLEVVRASNPAAVALEVRMCRCKPTYDKKVTRISFSVRGSLEPHRHMLLEAIKQCNGTVKSGRAPPSGLVRALQEMLEGWKI